MHVLKIVALIITNDKSEINIMSIKSFLFKHKDKKSDKKSMCFETLAKTVKKISVYDLINYLNVDTIV